MKENMDIDKIFDEFALLFISLGENICMMLNDATSAIDNYVEIMEDCEDEQKLEKLKLLRPYVLTLKSVTTIFSERIKTTEKEDGYIRSTVEDFLKKDERQ